MVAPPRSGKFHYTNYKAYVNSLYGKAREMSLAKVIGLGINGETLWDVQLFKDDDHYKIWLGTDLNSPTVMVHLSREEAIQLYLERNTHTDTVQSVNEHGKFLSVRPSDFRSSTLAGWIEGRITDSA